MWAPWQQRVLDEYEQLSDRIRSLTAFISVRNDRFTSLPPYDRLLLLQQLEAMVRYSVILAQRTMAFVPLNSEGKIDD